MDIKYNPPYVCLTTGYQEETKLLTQEIPIYFYNEDCLSIKNNFKSYMDDGFVIWLKYLDFNDFSICFQFFNNFLISIHSKKQM